MGISSAVDTESLIQSPHQQHEQQRRHHIHHLDKVLLPGETVLYGYEVPPTARLKEWGFWLLLHSAIALPLLWLLPLTAESSTPILVALAIVPVAEVVITYYMWAVKTTNIVTNYRAMVLTQYTFSRLYLKFQFFACMKEAVVDRNQIIFKPLAKEIPDLYAEQFILKFTDLDDLEYVYGLVCRIYKQHEHVLPEPADLSSEYTVEDLSRHQLRLLSLYLRNNPDDSVRWVYVPQLWQTLKTFTYVTLVEAVVFLWMTAGLMYETATNAITNDTYEPMKLLVIILFLVIVNLIFLYGAKRTYVITNKSILSFGTGLAVDTWQQGSLIESSKNERFYGSKWSRYLITTTINPLSLGTVTMSWKVGKPDASTIYFGWEYYSGLRDIQGTSQVMQHISNVLHNSNIAGSGGVVAADSISSPSSSSPSTSPHHPHV